LFFDRPSSGQRAVLVHVRFSERDEQDQIDEFDELVRSADIEPLALLTPRRAVPHARWFVGTGKLEELRAALADANADLLVFDHELTPAQQRNIETELECRVVTRTELILYIFASRARTHEGQLQVELAQLKHAQTRLVRGWTHLDRQKGGIGIRGGAGETQIELDRRMLADRVRLLDDRLEKVRKQRSQGRRKRQRAAVPTVALIGYTNAGKSTLFNALTRADVLAEDRLFATLDPTLRKLPISGFGDVVLADTVGFIRALPHSLVEAFKATLEEVAQADLLLHVIDVTVNDDQERAAQVLNVLEEIGAEGQPILAVYNKIDQVNEPPRIDRDAHGAPVAVWLSAARGDGVPLLRQAIGERLGADTSPTRVRLSPGAGKTRSWLYGLGAVLHEEAADDGGTELTVRLDAQTLAQLAARPGVLLPVSRAVHRIAPSPGP
jgi:GTP-binding protein HflX